jgi:leucyl aminopeptidase
MTLPRIALQPASQYSQLNAASHGLIILPAGAVLPTDLPQKAQWLAVLKRKKMKPKELSKTPLALDLPDGRRLALLMADTRLSRFERLTRLRKAIMLLLDETPGRLSIWVAAGEGMSDVARDAAYVAQVNGVPLPVRKKKPAVALTGIDLCSSLTAADLAPVVALARANLLARELTAMAPNELTPSTYRKRIRSVAKQAGLAIEEFDFRALRKMGAGAFCAVAQGSHHQDAAIVHLSWRPRLKDAAASKTVALVGKGICFDTGGLDIKPSSNMLLMKKDMGGAATAMALGQMIMAHGLDVRLRILVAAAENSIDGNAFRPSDVLKSRAGRTVEIGNTDAEGRLVLADALALACEEAPDTLLCFATLTGAARVALGPDLPAFFSDDDALAASVATAGLAVGDPVWRLPLWPGYERNLDSEVADMGNVADGPFAGAITAALFLKRFAAGARRFAHIDLYGWRPSLRPLGPKGGEAQTARALFEVLRAELEATS